MVNRILVLAVIAWATAQVLKFMINAAVNKTFDKTYLVTGGSMPSSHAAFVCACSTSVAFTCGLDSALFALSVTQALIVMYDAANVRKVTGKQSEILNYMMEHWIELKPDEFSENLKELIGHTWLQVAVGGVLGILIGTAGCLLWPWP